MDMQADNSKLKCGQESMSQLVFEKLERCTQLESTLIENERLRSQLFPRKDLSPEEREQYNRLAERSITIEKEVQLAFESLNEEIEARQFLPFTKNVATICSKDSITVAEKAKPQPQLLRTWELFSFCLSRKTKRDVFEPLFNELKENYLLAQRFRGVWAKRWLKFCFTLKTITMVCGCLRVTISSKLARLLLSFVPESVRKLFSN